MHGAAHGAHDPDDLVDQRSLAGGIGLDRHEVDNFSHAFLAQESRDQDVGFGQVHLPVCAFVGAGDSEKAALFVIQDRGEDTGRVEVRQTAPVDGSVHADERHRVHVADDAVMFDGLVGHVRAPVLSVYSGARLCK